MGKTHRRTAFYAGKSRISAAHEDTMRDLDRITMAARGPVALSRAQKRALQDALIATGEAAIITTWLRDVPNDKALGLFLCARRHQHAQDYDRVHRDGQGKRIDHSDVSPHTNTRRRLADRRRCAAIVRDPMLWEDGRVGGFERGRSWFFDPYH